MNIDRQTWQDWNIFCIKKTGTCKKVSEETERIIKQEMRDHPID